ncbi:MAG: carboxypeptidase regulatory-like domain-containing protein [Saprospiraceae bacterium]|nr:carboxypeptidase regulatory-like domain-containing protein [Saprospiraceae bacterium]
MKVILFLSSACLALASFFSTVEKTALSGTVTSETGEALIGATVSVMKDKAALQTVITDVSGKYRLELDSGIYEIAFSYTGYATRRILNVPVIPGRENSLDVRLEPAAMLDEVVVTGYSSPHLIKGASSLYGSGRSAATADKRTAAAPDAKVRSEYMKRDREVSAATHVSKPKPAEVPKTEPAIAAPPPPADYDEVVIDGETKKVRIVFSPETYEEVIEIVDETKDDAKAKEMPAPPDEAPGGMIKPRAGLLTAGEWNDLHNWNRHWADLLADGEIDEYQNMYGFYPKQRYTVMLTNQHDVPIADVVVQLQSAGATLWEARTDNTGKAELWAGLFDRAEATGLEISAVVDGATHEFGAPKPAKEGINRFSIEAECTAPRNVDIVWAVDATGSMGDELEYLKTELLDVIGRAKGRNPELSFRMGTVFYRDVTDAYITKSSGLSYDIAKTVDFIGKQSADGGGDYPEAVHSALEEAIFNQRWSEHAIARICFLVLDASPHRSPEVNASLQKSIREAARLGIRIVPVTASGIQKDTEFLMKFFGLATNGTYVFLTDHSGIGGKHLEPTTDEYKVEPLNELLVRLIAEYTGIETCEGKLQIRFEGDPQQQGEPWQALYYPNPASTQFTLELPFDVNSVTIYDSEGKAVRKLEKPAAGQHAVIVSDLSEGFYTIRILKDGQMQSGKLVVVRA